MQLGHKLEASALSSQAMAYREDNIGYYVIKIYYSSSYNDSG